ncbi:MAG: metallophosphoesterase, partial [Melioribacteraceae bacterium]|nr:metallophosphoesterase [Melioribacteraceae bacterium]
MKIIISGDIHGMYGYLNELIHNESPDLLIICGDMGYGFPNDKIESIVAMHTKVLFCDGNHDNHWKL